MEHKTHSSGVRDRLDGHRHYGWSENRFDRIDKGINREDT